jgi:hypothetical protein
VISREERDREMKADREQKKFRRRRSERGPDGVPSLFIRVLTVKITN